MKDLKRAANSGSPLSQPSRRQSPAQLPQQSSRQNSYAARKSKKNKGNPVINFLAKLAAIAFIALCLFSIVGTYSEMAGKRTELDALAEKAAHLELENEEYRNILSEDDERAFMERVAKDLGYAYPNERRFIDRTRN